MMTYNKNFVIMWIICGYESSHCEQISDIDLAYFVPVSYWVYNLHSQAKINSFIFIFLFPSFFSRSDIYLHTNQRPKKIKNVKKK